jgi:hypothetical protein
MLVLFLVTDAVAQVRVGHMRSNRKVNKKRKKERVTQEERMQTRVFSEIREIKAPQSRKELDANFYVQWNEKSGLNFENFQCNKGLYNKFLPSKDTDLTKVIYPDYRIFYQKLNERMLAANGIDDELWRARIANILTEHSDSMEADDFSEQMVDSGFMYTISVDSPAASVITISPLIYAVNESTYYYNISALFSKYESWMIIKSKDILEHEQIHFDIFELYARRMRRTLVETLRKNYADGMTGDLTNEISPEFERIYQQLNDLQLDFDRETMALTAANAPLLKTNTKWKDYLRAQIAALSAYEIPEGTVILK